MRVTDPRQVRARADSVPASTGPADPGLAGTGRTRSGRTNTVLSNVLVAATALTSGGSLVLPEVYRDVASGRQFSDVCWHANDLVSLLGVVPLALAARRAARRGSLRAELLWLGTVCYVLYTYLFYVFGATLNHLYPVYVALAVLSGTLLVLAVRDLDARGLGVGELGFGRLGLGDTGTRGARRPSTDLVVICVTMALFAVIAAVTWVAQWADLVGGGQSDTPAAEFVRSVAAVDIAFLTVGMLRAAALLWGRRPWGYVAAVVLNVSTALYMGVLALAAWANGRAGVPGAAGEVPLWLALHAVCLAVSLWLLRGPGRRHTPVA